MEGSLALRLFQNDYITSFKFKKLNIFFCSYKFEFYFEWLALKATGYKIGGDESDGAEVAVPKSPVPCLTMYNLLNDITNCFQIFDIAVPSGISPLNILCPQTD